MSKKLFIICALLLTFGFTLTPAPSTSWAYYYSYPQFKRIGQGGFGDSANSYSWGMWWFNDELYVGTVRHHLWSLVTGFAAQAGTGFFGDLPPGLLEDLLASAEDLLPLPPDDITWGNADYAEAMRAEIWRYRKGAWERVHQSPTFTIPTDIEKPIPGTDPPQKFVIPAGAYPEAYGYRTLGEYSGHLYACGVGTWIPPMPFSSVIRSETGDPDSWEDVTGILQTTNNVRGLVEWRDKLYVAASLPGPFPGIGGEAVVYEFAEDHPGKWKEVSLPAFGTGYNAEIYFLQVFNDHLYASTVNFETGFEVWKTDGQRVDNDEEKEFVWTRVIKNGFGDTWNQYGMTMRPFGDYLYVGTAAGAGMVQKNGQVVGSRPLEVIRLDKDDNAELVVGNAIAYDPIEGGPQPRIPLSGWPAGFGNPFNVYSWHMGVYQGCLYLGTFDMSGLISKIIAEDPGILELFMSLFPASNLRFPSFINSSLMSGRMTSLVANLFYKIYGGGDVWKTCDGKHWTAVTLNGFNNPKNYGIRRLVPYKDQALAVGTANPFTGRENGGCEVWLTGRLPSSSPIYPIFPRSNPWSWFFNR